MALYSDAAMVLFYDIDGNTADHDDWHSYEHFHERLSVPGFRRATRWVARDAEPRYLVTYEVSDVDVATSKGYLDRLNDPTPWTSEMMLRFRGMIRGFCHITAGSGFGFGQAAMALRFLPIEGEEERLSTWIAQDVLPAVTSRRGIVSAHLFRPVPPPPMTREQALRGPDKAMPWMVLVTACDDAALEQAVAAHLSPESFQSNGASEEIILGSYGLHYTATAEEAARTAPLPVLTPEQRAGGGPRG
ncbi:hypothetical protein [Roseibium aggregatum]|uniref:Uncharacterized protein n=1 Tax=Roseibium aggregatum TaxID=187304 RepID=A0A926NV27_9HYPH|nr:hypothetical protein [Roseibium aggregatum]MBD1544650.1 hypothetical protein [Roseibium aggregatum]